MQSQTRDSGSSTINPGHDHDLSSTDAVNDNRKIRSFPPWVETIDDEAGSDRLQRLLRPTSTVNANHHYLPAPQQNKAPGRKWDHLRDAEPALLDQSLHESSARWLPYMVAGPQPSDSEGARLVSDEWMEQNMPGMTGPWHAHEIDLISEKQRDWWLLSSARRRNTAARVEHTILKNPFVPLVFRLTVLTFTLVALGLGGRIWHKADHVKQTTDHDCVQRASTYMALIIDSIAVPYIGIVTWDEYMSKPLGLRSAKTKTALILFDLYFIVFYSSNLSLAMDAMTDRRWACFQDGDTGGQTCPNSPEICSSQAALSGVLVVALIAWLITFSISVLRVVERLR